MAMPVAGALATVTDQADNATYDDPGKPIHALTLETRRRRVPPRVALVPETATPSEFGRKAHMPNRKAAELRSMDGLEARLNAEKPTSRPSF